MRFHVGKALPFLAFVFDLGDLCLAAGLIIWLGYAFALVLSIVWRVDGRL